MEVGTTHNAHAEVTRVGAHFDQLVERYGDDHRALDYGSRQSQRIRFEVLASGLALSNRRVLDVGCGMGDFKDYLDGCGMPVAYAGVDASARMIELARARHPGEEFSAGDVLAPGVARACDVAVANGIFYLLGACAAELMQNIVARMWALAEEAVAFTSLSAWSPRAVNGEFHADPLGVVKFCRSLTPWVRLRHDYLPHDFAVFLYKRPVDA